MKIGKNLAISDSGFIFNPSTGDSFSVNQVGLDIIRLLKSGKSQTDVIDDIVSRYNTDTRTVEKDLGDFFLMLRNYQLLESYE